MVNILIRADAGVHVGAGHVMRCLALAQACLAQGGEVVFLSRCENEALRQRIRSLGCNVLLLEEAHPAATDLQKTIATFTQLTRDRWRATPSFLVLDGYHFDAAYHKAVKANGCSLLVIDDTGHLPHYGADILLNSGLNAARMPYHYSEKTVPLFGPRYVLLRPEFLTWREWRREAPPVARRVLVTLGGSDPHNATLHILQALTQLAEPSLEARVVLGPLNPWKEELRQIARHASGRIQLLTDVHDMPRLMAWADLAICAGGGTSWELGFMGTPMLTVVLADNQYEAARGLSDCRMGVNLGAAADLQPTRLTEEVRALLYDRDRRQQMGTVGRALVDGVGAERVITLLSGLHREKPGEVWHFRLATMEDAGLLWQWANDSQTRANSFRQDAIPWEHHAHWYASKLHAVGTRIWLLEYHGEPVGQIRYDRLTADLAEISYVVAPGWRGRGIGSQLLTRSSSLACAELGVRRLQGITFVDNIASVRAFQRAGYQNVKEDIIEGRACFVFAWTQP